METWNIRAACIIFFFLLVSQRLGSSCASIQEQERAPLRFGNSITESSSNSGASCSLDGKVLALLLKGDKLSGGRAPESQKFSEDLSDGGLQSCRKFLTKTIRGVIQRRLLDPDHSSKSTDHESGTKKPSILPHWAIYTIVISGAVLLVVIAGTTMYLLFNRRKKDHTVTPWSTGLSGPLRKAFVAGVPSLERAELQTACEDFINVIGSSPDCILYKGTLSSGVEIAVVSTSVNSAKDWSDKSEEQFKNKISMLSRVNHKNLMNLLGYCTCDEPFTRMMVLEYAPCGSLFEHLHIREAEDLDWPTRLRTIMGVEYCLEHMSQLDPLVMPATLSSSSIYLTEDYAAKISDIEFCKGGKDAAESQSDQESIVYKFGILLLEVISGRVPFSEDHGLLVLWASSYLDGKRALNGMVDPTLRSSVPDRDVAALCDVVKLCIDPERGEREESGHGGGCQDDEGCDGLVAGAGQPAVVGGARDCVGRGVNYSQPKEQG